MDASAAGQDLGLNTNPLIAMGRIGRPHGVRGELRFWLHNEASNLLHEGQKIWVGPEDSELAGAVQSYAIESARRDPKGWLVCLVGVHDRDQAANLAGLTWFESRENFVPLEDGELYLVDLIGCQLCTPVCGNVGQVIDVCEAAGMNYLVVQVGKEERLVPARREFLLRYDALERVLTVVDLEGLLQD